MLEVVVNGVPDPRRRVDECGCTGVPHTHHDNYIVLVLIGNGPSNSQKHPRGPGSRKRLRAVGQRVPKNSLAGLLRYHSRHFTTLICLFRTRDRPSSEHSCAQNHRS